MFTIQMLGTSSGVPTKTRNVSGTALTLPNSKDWVLIDCGEGTQHRLLHCNLSLLKLKAIFITHVHGDHCYGLPGLISSAAMAGRSEPLLIVAPREIETFYNAVKTTTQPHLTFELIFIESHKMNKLKLGSTNVSATELSHRVPSHAFCFDVVRTERKLITDKLEQAGIPKGPVWGKLQKGEDVTLEDGAKLSHQNFVNEIEIQRKVIIAGDNDDPSLLASAVKNADLLLHEATFTEEILKKVGSRPQHSSAKRIAMFAQEQDIPNLMLTHFSARLTGTTDSLEEDPIAREAKSYYQGNLFLAQDLDKYELGRDGTFKLTQ